MTLQSPNEAVGLEFVGAHLALVTNFNEGPRAFVEKRAPRWMGR